jgi:NADPH-dependent glutamate synthase beta subunit-like oxidoreductase
VSRGQVRSGGEAALPAARPDTGRRVAVVGGGPAGLAAAWLLRRSVASECAT